MTKTRTPPATRCFIPFETELPFSKASETQQSIAFSPRARTCSIQRFHTSQLCPPCTWTGLSYDIGAERDTAKHQDPSTPFPLFPQSLKHWLAGIYIQTGTHAFSEMV